MTFTKLLQERELLQEGTCYSVLGISEDESSFIQYRNLILVLKLSSFIPTNYRFVDESSIAREIFDDGNGISTFILCENQTVPIRDYCIIDNEIWYT